MRRERRRNPNDHGHECAVRWVIFFVGISMIAALIGGIAGIFMRSMANEHTKDMITGSFTFAQMALTGLLGLLAKTGLEGASTQTGDVNVGNPGKSETIVAEPGPVEEKGQE